VSLGPKAHVSPAAHLDLVIIIVIHSYVAFSITTSAGKLVVCIQKIVIPWLGDRWHGRK
jgi:hypothetical protein